MDTAPNSICERLFLVRTRLYGRRGRSRLCRDLGITPSTYALYEINRTPPVELLIRVAQLTQIPLAWLMTGEGDIPVSLTQQSGEQILPEAPDPRNDSSAQRGWIPIIGSTAAGTARFWEEMPMTHGGPEADRLLDIRLASYSQQARSESISASEIRGTGTSAQRVSLIQCSTPDNRGFIEFLNSPHLKRDYPRAVAWRIDGDSMSPRYLDGDFVICSLDHPAVAGHPCVARQKGQIGVNCKIYQETDRDILLIPINESCRVQRLRRSALLWAWRVLGSVRIGPSRLDVS